MRSAVWHTIPIAITLAAAMALRHGLIEPETIAHSCGSPGAPLWCAPRAVVIAAFATNGIAIGSVVAGVLAIVTRRSSLAVLAACLGVAGLVLYSYEAGAVALLAGLLVLAREHHARRQRAA